MSLGRAAILVENLSVPFDRRVWQEATSLHRAGYDVSVICPRGQKQDTEPHAVIDGVSIHRYPLRAAGGGPLTYAGEYATAFRSTISILRGCSGTPPFDVVHACNPPDPLIYTALPARRQGRRTRLRPPRPRPGALPLAVRARRVCLYRATLVAERLAFRLADVVIEHERLVPGDRDHARPQAPRGRVRRAERARHRAVPAGAAGSGASRREAVPARLPRRDGAAGRRRPRAPRPGSAARPARRLAGDLHRWRRRARADARALGGAEPVRRGGRSPGGFPTTMSSASSRRPTSASRPTRRIR